MNTEDITREILDEAAERIDDCTAEAEHTLTQAISFACGRDVWIAIRRRIEAESSTRAETETAVYRIIDEGIQI